MRALLAGLALLLLLDVPPVFAGDPLVEARRLYNAGDYTAAARQARQALELHPAADSARLVLGRSCLEIYRQTADQADLTEARNALKGINAEALDWRERAELSIGFAQTLFFEDRFGSASEMFERVLDVSLDLGRPAHERVLDWWATALDRLALSRPVGAREVLYERIARRMERELAEDPASSPAAYWLPAALRGSGNLERAWHAAAAGWVSAALGRDGGAALRADIDRLVTRGIIPDRAARLQPKDPQPAGAVMLAEWEAFKTAWTR